MGIVYTFIEEGWRVGHTAAFFSDITNKKLYKYDNDPDDNNYVTVDEYIVTDTKEETGVVDITSEIYNKKMVNARL